MLTKLTARSGQRLSQQPQELAALLELFAAEGVRRYLEIGARHGDTFDHVMRSLSASAVGVAVDWPEQMWGKPGSRTSLESAIRDLQADGYDVCAVFGPSQAAETMQSVRLRGPYDAVLIDADHRYAGVLADWHAYGAQARLVAFHDIAGAGMRERASGAPVQVPRLWAELRSHYRHVELIAPGSRFGIGVLWRVDL